MPAWNHTLDLADVFHDEDLTFDARRDVIVARVRAAKFINLGGFAVIADELADAKSNNEFDEIWSAFYDEADAFRVWVNTW